MLRHVGQGFLNDAIDADFQRLTPFVRPFGPRTSSVCTPVRCEKLRTYASSVTARPKSSSIGGWRSCERSRTDWIA